MAKRGRPTDYRKEHVEFVEDYLKECDEKQVMPFMEEVARRLDVYEDTITNWGKKHKEFLGAIKKLKQMQKMTLKASGLTQAFNPTMCIFLLKANHGFVETEKKLHEHTGDVKIVLHDSLKVKGKNKVKSSK
jgi:hypothetical protein